MAIGINGDGGFGTLQALNQAQTQSQVAGARLASAERINSARDDAAGLAISNRLVAQFSETNQARRNAGDGISLAQTAEGSLASVQEGLQRVQTLSLQAANGALNDSDRQALQQEAAAIGESIRNTLETAEFNGRPLFQSDEGIAIAVGDSSEIAVPGRDLAALGQRIAEIDISSQQGAQAALQVASDELEVTSEFRAELGAAQSRLGSRIDQLAGQAENQAASLSRVADTDFAREVSNRIQGDVRQQAAIAIQSQANADAGNVLKLLQ